jgi:glycosyltransferase involved in cell wall biosynthesis
MNMKVTVISHEFPPLGTGASNALSHILPRLAGLGWDVNLITAHFGDLPTEEISSGVSIHRVACGRKSIISPSAKELVGFLWQAQRPAYQLVDSQRPDVILAFFTIPAGHIARLVSCRFHIPYVVSLRGSDVPGHNKQRFGGLLEYTRPWVRHIWRNAAAVVAPSSWLRDGALQTAPQQPIEIIPNGIDLEQVGPMNQHTTSHREPLKVIFVGQLIPLKGVDLLLRAVARLPHVRLAVVGDGPERPMLEQLSQELSIDHRTQWHGRLEKHQVFEQLRAADVLLQPTEAEGMSNTVLEALAVGIPVVTTVAGAADLIDHAVEGFVIERSVEAIHQALVRLEDASLRHTMGNAARRRAEQMSWESTAWQWNELLRSITDATHPKTIHLEAIKA